MKTDIVITCPACATKYSPIVKDEPQFFCVDFGGKCYEPLPTEAIKFIKENVK